MQLTFNNIRCLYVDKTLNIGFNFPYGMMGLFEFINHGRLLGIGTIIDKNIYEIEKDIF